jgi:hypothetical protein
VTVTPIGGGGLPEPPPLSSPPQALSPAHIEHSATNWANQLQSCVRDMIPPPENLCDRSRSGNSQQTKEFRAKAVGYGGALNVQHALRLAVPDARSDQVRL